MSNLNEIVIKPMPSEASRIEDKRFKKLHPNLFKIAFMATVYGRIGTGKTSCIYSLLNDYYKIGKKSVFDEIIIYCANFESDEAFEALPCDNIKVLHSFDQDSFLTYIDDVRTTQLEREKRKKRLWNICIVMDDMVSANLLKKCDGESPLEKAILTCRHIGISLFFSSQYYKSQGSLRSNIRANMTSFALYEMGQAEMEKASCELSEDFTPKEFFEIYKHIAYQKHNFVTIDTRRPYGERLWEQFKYPIKRTDLVEDAS